MTVAVDCFGCDLLIGRKVRHLRWQRGESQLELAEALGITITEVQLYEAGVRTVPFLLLQKIAEAQETPSSYYTKLRKTATHGRN